MNFYGRIVSFKPPTATRGTGIVISSLRWTNGVDYLMALVVVDDSMAASDDSRELNGLTVSIFKNDLSLFPPVTQEDEIVQFRHIKVQEFQSKLQAVASHYTTYTVFYRNEDGEWEARPSRPVEPDEKVTLDRISAKTGHTAARVRSSPSKLELNRRQLTIDLIRPNLYLDLIAQVVKVLPSTREDHVQVLLSDYTSNIAITLSPGVFDLSIDLEHRLLITSFWDNYAETAANLREGHIIKVVNLRSKDYDFFYESGEQTRTLICTLHGDRNTVHRTQKIFLLKNDSQEAQVILQRRHELLGDKRQSFHLDDSDRKEAAFSEQQPQPLLQKPHTPRRFDSQLFDTQPIPNQQHQQPVIESKSTAQLPPTTILHSNIKVVPIRTILDKKEKETVKYLIRGRVEKVIPTNYHNLCRSKCEKCNETVAPKRNSSCSKCGALLSDFHFLFLLHITDGTDTITVYVANEHAVRFLNGTKPCNLRSNPEVLEYVRNSMDSLLKSTVPSLFCIYSYPTEDTIKYFLFDTVLSIQ